MFFALQEQRIEFAGKKMPAAIPKVPDNSAVRLAALREFYSDLKVADGAILDVEFKLYAPRNPASRKEWCEHYS